MPWIALEGHVEGRRSGKPRVGVGTAHVEDAVIDQPPSKAIGISQGHVLGALASPRDTHPQRRRREDLAVQLGSTGARSGRRSEVRTRAGIIRTLSPALVTPAGSAASRSSVFYSRYAPSSRPGGDEDSTTCAPRSCMAPQRVG